MQYLYGDSSTSPFTSNLLELLRDAIDFCVYVLEADKRIASTRQHAEQLRARAQADVDQIEALGRTVASTIDSTDKGKPDSPASACAARMITVCEETVHSAAEGVRVRLASDIAQAEAEEATERDGCLNALLTLLEPNDLPDSSTVLRVTLAESGSYQAVLEGVCAPFGLKWRRELDIPDTHAFKHQLRVESLQGRLEVEAPEVSGWIKKQVTVRTQHLERYLIAGITLEGSKVVLRLRTELGSEDGFNLACDTEAGSIIASRLLPAANQAAAGPFDVEAEDAPKLIELCESVHEQLNELKATRAFEASFEDTNVLALSTFVPVVERLIGYLSPMAQDIARHSLEPDELVLRRQLADDRREEIFVSKTTLRQKYEHLSAELGGFFAPLGLRSSLSRSMAPIAHTDSTATTRSELPPSNPPPPPTKPIAAAVAVPVAPPAPALTRAVEPPSSMRMRGVSSQIPKTASASRAAVPPPAAAPAPSKPTSPKASALAPTSSAAPEPAASPREPLPTPMEPAPVDPPPIVLESFAPVVQPSRASSPDEQGKSQDMATTLRRVLEKILELDGAGRQPDAHRECAQLLEGTGFGGANAEDQRRVLKLLLVLETRSVPSEARLRALRAGRDRAHGLIERLGEPADYELKGLCQLALNDAVAAGETFRKGLELESSRNAESELCARLRRHAAAV